MTVEQTLVDADRSKAIIRSRCEKLCEEVAFDGAEYHNILRNMAAEFDMITSFHFYWNATQDYPFDYKCKDIYEQHSLKFFAAGYDYHKK
jgi:hypothetical protein